MKRLIQGLFITEVQTVHHRSDVIGKEQKIKDLKIEKIIMINKVIYQTRVESSLIRKIYFDCI